MNNIQQIKDNAEYEDNDLHEDNDENEEPDVHDANAENKSMNHIMEIKDMQTMK